MISIVDPNSAFREASFLPANRGMVFIILHSRMSPPPTTEKAQVIDVISRPVTSVPGYSFIKALAAFCLIFVNSSTIAPGFQVTRTEQTVSTPRCIVFSSKAITFFLKKASDVVVPELMPSDCSLKRSPNVKPSGGLGWVCCPEVLGGAMTRQT